MRKGTKVDSNGLDNRFELFTITNNKDKKQYEDIIMIDK